MIAHLIVVGGLAAIAYYRGWVTVDVSKFMADFAEVKQVVMNVVNFVKSLFVKS